jgi:putative endonuclease
MRKQGQLFEQFAKKYLEKRGLVPVCDNFNSRTGEIDLIMLDNKVMVFIEVKYRASTNFGGAVAAIGRNKQQKIVRTAMFYCQSNNINFEHAATRFDVVAITGSHEPFDIQWIKHAFPT